MGNLEEFQQPFVTEIYRYYEAKHQRKSRRMGGSALGDKCDRKLWLSFRHAFTKKFDGRLLRLFETGHIQEDRIIEALRGAGHHIVGVGEEQHEFTACNGHFVDKPDGLMDGKYRLEIKTMSEKNFKLFKKNGMEYKHEVQCQMHMFLGDTPKLLYLAVNKNTDEVAQAKVTVNKEQARALIGRADRIINSPSAPDKISDDPNNFGCRWCDMKPICFEGVAPEESCRMCVFSQPASKGQWYCNKKCIEMIDTQGIIACGYYEAIKI